MLTYTHTQDKFYLPVLIKLEQGLVLSATQHQEINEQKHAKWVRFWVQAAD